MTGFFALRRILLLLPLLAAVLLPAAEPAFAQASNPLTGGAPAGESAPEDTNADANPMTGGAAQRAAQRAAEPPGLVTRILGAVQLMQVQLGRSVNTAVAELREGRSFAAVAGLLGLALAYGVLHALGPGHGKFVVSSYFLARDAKLRHGVAAAGLISLVQALSAIVIIGVLALAIGGSRMEMLERAEMLERVSYALIIAFGFYVAWKAWTGRECCGGHAEADGRGLLPLALAVGVRPCSGALLILVFTLAHGIFLLGVAATFAMGLGVAATVSAFGVGAIGARRGLFSASGLNRQPETSCGCGHHDHGHHDHGHHDHGHHHPHGHGHGHDHGHDHTHHHAPASRRERVARRIAIGGGFFVAALGALLLAGSLSAPVAGAF